MKTDASLKAIPSISLIWAVLPLSDLIGVPISDDLIMLIPFVIALIAAIGKVIMREKGKEGE